jgi:uncharacterized protein (TIGR02646 family)
MIKVSRTPEPRILERKATEWKEKLLGAKTQAERKRAEGKYRHAAVKRSLVQMFHGKCAYCGSKLTHIDYGHIEHYRPKRGSKGRPDLTFEWSNLLLACGICNGPEHKSDRFPERNEDGPIVNPIIDDPTVHFDFQYDPVARLANVYGRTPRGATTEELLGLNRTHLREYRSRRVRRLVVLGQYADSDQEAAQLLKEAVQSDAEYAAFARALFGWNQE